MQTPFLFPSTVDFVLLKAAHSFLVVLPLGWAKWPTALSINSLPGWPLLPRENSASPKLQDLEVLSLRDSLRCSTHKDSTSTIGDVIANSTTYKQFPTDSSTRARIPFVGSRVTRFCNRPISAYQDSYLKFYEEFYEQRWYQKWTAYHVFWGVLQKYLKRLVKQTLFWLIVRSRSLWDPKEQVDRKKRDVRPSALTHACHTHCTLMYLGMTADQSMMFLRTDFVKHVIWQGSVEKPTANVIVVRKVCTIDLDKVPGTSWNTIRCKEHLRSCLAAVFWQATINLIVRVWKSIHDSRPGLYCVDLAEAYVTQENVSSRILTRKGMICDCPMDVCTRNLCKEQWNGKRKQVLILVPGSNECFTSRKCVMCARNMGVHVWRSIRSTKGKRTG